MSLKDGKIDLIGHKYGISFETVAYRTNETCFSVVAYLAQLQESTGCYGFCRIHDIVQQKETKKELRTAKMEVEETHKAVSYTHLDVYKRQAGKRGLR